MIQLPLAITLALGLFVLVASLRNPYHGFLLVVLVNFYDTLLRLPIDLTIGRYIGILTAIGWLVHYVLPGRSSILGFKKINVIFYLMILSMFISSFLAQAKNPSFSQSLTIFLQFISVFFILDMVRTKQDLMVLVKIMYICATIAGVIGILQYMGFLPVDITAKEVVLYQGDIRITGFRGNPNGYGLFLMSGIPFLTYSYIMSTSIYQRMFKSAMMMLIIIPLFLTMSRTHVLHLFLFFTVYVFIASKFNIFSKQTARIVFSVILIVLLVVIFRPKHTENRLLKYTFSGHDTSSAGRIRIMQKAFGLLPYYPIFGLGFGNFERTHLPGQATSFLIKGHDIFSYLMISTGLFGFSLFIIFCVFIYNNSNYVLKYVSRYDRELTNFMLVMHSAFVSIIAITPFNPIVNTRVFWIYVGVIMIMRKWCNIHLEHIIRSRNNHAAT